MIGPLSWVLLYTADVARLRAFYENVMGLRVKKASELIVAFDTGACVFEIMGRMDNGPASIDDVRGWQRNKFLPTFHVEDIHAEVARLEALGAVCITGVRPTVSPPGMAPRGWIAQFLDPDGNIVELGQMPL
jgi:predicted enzyme related to lactoylglutathione lyase